MQAGSAVRMELAAAAERMGTSKASLKLEADEYTSRERVPRIEHRVVALLYQLLDGIQGGARLGQVGMPIPVSVLRLGCPAKGPDRLAGKGE